MKKGTLRPNGITLASFEADFVNPPTGKMTAKAAFVNSETGATHGWTTQQIWSPATIQKLGELKEAMEVDLAGAHFVNGEEDAGPAPRQQGLSTGLGEHLASHQEDAESIK